MAIHIVIGHVQEDALPLKAFPHKNLKCMHMNQWKALWECYGLRSNTQTRFVKKDLPKRGTRIGQHPSCVTGFDLWKLIINPLKKVSQHPNYFH